MSYSQHEIVWYLRALNALRRLLGRPEKRYLTDYEWKRYMDELARSAIASQRSNANRLGTTKRET